ncbi:cyclin-T2 isoform X2 [Eurytemora carolleeae]|uniref:cyclin-T2 isoform X2 n=1 Tax=Eurytemora carolleeae TaxID=1294199 RepID=UPI000C77E94F|nr:cyclin-T2 isoform X2 [Eurytemora carolleeae]|eukprot:XP_023323720.1 cyclin-T2-like isoform X2 [Eurytemora affinis]
MGELVRLGLVILYSTAFTTAFHQPWGAIHSQDQGLPVFEPVKLVNHQVNQKMESRIGRHYEPLSDELNPYQQPSTFIDPLTKRGGYQNIPHIPGYSDSLFQPGMPEINNMFLQDEDYQELEYPLPGDVPYQQRFGTAINQKHPEDAFQGLNIQNDDGVDDFFDGFGKDQFFQGMNWDSESNEDEEEGFLLNEPPSFTSESPVNEVKEGKTTGLLPGQSYNPKKFQTQLSQKRELTQEQYQKLLAKHNANSQSQHTSVEAMQLSVHEPEAIAQIQALNNEMHDKAIVPPFNSYHADGLSNLDMQKIISHTFLGGGGDKEKSHSHVYTHEHSHAHTNDHSHDHKHAHDANHSHAHAHSHNHHAHANHTHQHAHGHEHSSEHKHAHLHQGEHSHSHSHTNEHKHGHEHEHKSGHKHLHQHQAEHGHAHKHEGEHKHSHIHEHHHHHHHKHEHASDHKHGHEHQHDHKGIY